MSIEKIEEFAESGEKHLNNLDVKQGFQQAEKPERQWFNYLLNDFSKKINQVIDGLSDIDFEFDGFAPKISELESNYTEISSELTRVSDDFKSADAVLQGQIDSIGGGKFAYTTYAKMEAAAALPDEDPLKLPANSSIDVTNDTDPLKNGTYSYDGAVFAKSIYDVETIVRTKVLNTFKTKLLMDASALPDGADAQVTDDSVAENNGLYVKTAGAWVKSKYDINSMIFDVLSNYISHNTSSNLLELEDINGEVVVTLDEDGGLSLVGLPETVQKTLETLSMKEVIWYDESTDLFRVVDRNGKPILQVTRDGKLFLVGEEYQSNPAGVLGESLIPQGMVSKDVEKVGLFGTSPFIYQERIIEASTNNATQAMTPTMTRIGGNEFYLVTTEGGLGDFAPSTVYGYKITVDKENSYSLSISLAKKIVENGTDVDGDYAASGGTLLYVREGAHAGRLYVYYLKRYGAEKDVTCYVYSDDLGETWSSPVDMTPFIPLMEDWRVVLASPAEIIQVTQGKYKGRILIPAWRGDKNYPNSQSGLKAFIMYSDDGGETYHMGAESTVVGSNESAIAQVNDDTFAFITRDPSLFKHIEYTYDGGVTLTDKRLMEEVITTKCQSSFVQARNDYDLSLNKLILCAPTGDAETTDPYARRKNLGLYLSYDGGRNFDTFRQIVTGYSAYSALQIIDEHHIIVAFCSNSSLSTIDAVVVNLTEVFKGN